MRHRVILIAVLAVFAGCAAPAGSAPISTPPASPSPPPASNPLSQAPSGPPTEAPTATPAATTTVACPTTDEAISVEAYLTAVEAELEEGGPACFGSSDVTVLGWADEAPGVGFSPPGIGPGWLWIPTGALWDRSCDQDCGFLWVHVDPDSDVRWQADGRWVLVTGHTGDAAAETCRWVYPSGWTGDLNDDADARAHCRGSFVVTSVERTPNVP